MAPMRIALPKKSNTERLSRLGTSDFAFVRAPRPHSSYTSGADCVSICSRMAGPTQDGTATDKTPRTLGSTPSADFSNKKGDSEVVGQGDMGLETGIVGCAGTGHDTVTARVASVLTTGHAAQCVRVASPQPMNCRCTATEGVVEVMEVGVAVPGEPNWAVRAFKSNGKWGATGELATPAVRKRGKGLSAKMGRISAAERTTNTGTWKPSEGSSFAQRATRSACLGFSDRMTMRAGWFCGNVASACTQGLASRPSVINA
mmetsp:Transcript_19365/g.55533  ORF Transcript_19365/g.55533 Transcript_19365/m.55533 type:complete len:259 (+) Transcript_19365:458-1234(+)